MKTQKKIQVFRIEYEKPPTMTYFTAYVAALSHEESIAHIKKIMGNDIFVVTSGLICPLHDITQNVRNMISTSVPEQKETSITQKNNDEKLENTEDELTFKSGRGRKVTTTKAKIK